MISDNFQNILAFLTRRRGKKRVDVTDVIAYVYLIVGTLLMFGPVVWLFISSFKPLDGIYEFPPTLLPYKQESVQIKGYDQPLPLYDVKLADGSVRRLAQISQVGIGARMIDPNAPDEKPIDVKIEQRIPVKSVYFELENYTGAVTKFPFMTYLGNTVFVTVVATLITLLINSMAAFALSKYNFRGRDAIFVLIISTLMVPVSVILVPAFFVLFKVGLTNNLWGLIIPGAATPCCASTC
jgi:alpha-1,4-digalacturonate transport system permease protein